MLRVVADAGIVESVLDHSTSHSELVVFHIFHVTQSQASAVHSAITSMSMLDITLVLVQVVSNS